MRGLESMRQWDGAAAGAAVFPNGSIERFGDTDRVFELASLTKLYTGMAALVAHEEGTLGLDAPLAGGVTPADLLAHTAGIAPDDRRWISVPHTRRVYSTAAYDMLADELTDQADMPFAAYAAEAVAVPLQMETFTLTGSAGAGASGSVEDMIRLASAWRDPVLVDHSTLERATHPHLPDLAGVLPGYGRHEPNPWGLGPEIRGTKSPHWTADGNDPTTFGHFGRTGTMLWIDPVASITLVALSDQGFGPWAQHAWPRLGSDVLAAAG